MTLSQINPNQLRSLGVEQPGLIVQVGPDRRIQAIERLVRTGAHADGEHTRRFLEYARLHRINLNHMWSRLDGRGQIEATVLIVPNPGRTAMVFSSHPTSGEEVARLGQLIDHACGNLAGLDVNLAQALLEPAEAIDREAFAAGGFAQLAVLNYMERPLEASRANQAGSDGWPEGTALVTYAESRRGVFVEALNRSYEQTLDCPGLRGRRRTSDILEGHRASGNFDPRLWSVVEIAGEPEGVVLLNPSADRQSLELVYLGVAKRWRGRGLGTRLLRHGLDVVGGRSERTMNLAVDESNAPAIALYQRHGFRTALRRVAMIRPLGL